MAETRLRFAFAGDRDVAVDVLAHLLATGDRPAALLLSDPGRASHDAALVQLCETARLTVPVIRGRELADPAVVQRLRELDLDFLVCIHFPYLLRRAVLEIPRAGVLNLHPSFLPYNRGWHTPSWALLDGTPAGATLHYMDETLDTGDVISQRQLPVEPCDTAHTLYERLKKLEVAVFREGWQRIRQGLRAGVPQEAGRATTHRRQALFDPAVQRIDLDQHVRAGDLLRRLRALTTNRMDEAAYFESGGRRYRVQISIVPEPLPAPVVTEPALAAAGESR